MRFMARVALGVGRAPRVRRQALRVVAHEARGRERAHDVTLEEVKPTKYYFHNGSRVAMHKEGVLYYLVGDHGSSRTPWRA